VKDELLTMTLVAWAWVSLRRAPTPSDPVRNC
jgi:hypothetical protein